MEHEIIHIKARHSIDILIVEVIHVFFWFNPILHLYRSAIKSCHEFYTDKAMTKKYTKDTYCMLLTGHDESGIELALCNHFFNSLIKNRIMMMYRHPSKRSALFKYLAVAPIMFCVLLSLVSNEGLAQKKATNQNSSKTISQEIPPPPPPAPPPPPIMKKKNKGQMQPPPPPSPPEIMTAEDGSKIYTFTAIKPKFKCYENKCGDVALFKFIGDNIRYPEEAKFNKIRGHVIVNFIIMKDGSITNPRVLKSLGSGLDEEALRVVNLLPKWEPGKHKGEAVHCSYTLPVTFVPWGK